MVDKCIKAMRKIITEKKMNEPTMVSIPSFHSILPRKSTILDIARRPTMTGSHGSNIFSREQKEKNRNVYKGLDPIFKNVAKRTIYEYLKLEDLDAPWNYYTDGVFHYNVGNILKDGDYFGELGLLTKKPRKATVLCTEDTWLIFLEKDDYKNVVESVDQTKMSKKLHFFEKYFLKGFTDEGILKMQYFFLKKIYGLNQIIFQENDTVDGCYLIKKGELTVKNYINNSHKVYNLIDSQKNTN